MVEWIGVFYVLIMFNVVYVCGYDVYIVILLGVVLVLVLVLELLVGVWLIF